MSAILWTKGSECESLATVLANGPALRAEGNLYQSCVDSGAVLLVAPRLISLDLCSVATPHGFDQAGVASVVAAVGLGPHSMLAAAVADRLALQLGVPGKAVFGYTSEAERVAGSTALKSISTKTPGLQVKTVQASSPAEMLGSLADGTLLVLGAPGGSWFQRQFFSPGARIRAIAPGGTIVVRHSPPHIYQVMRPPRPLGPTMRVADALQVAAGEHLVVAEDGRLLGLVTQEALLTSGPDIQLREVMDEPVFLSPDELLDDADRLIAARPAATIPVLDRSDHIIGVVRSGDIAPPSLL
jgi:CBS domain-containing protein